jgi:hypothetical protein
LQRNHACCGRRKVGDTGASRNGDVDDERLESVNVPIPATGSGGAHQQSAAACPTHARVDDTTDLNQAGFQAGYLSGYGIRARMRVFPDRVDWAGKQVVESLSQVSSTCPPGLTVGGPCNGNSTFTVGAASGNSAVSPQQPGVRNCFHDFHTSRSQSVSFLHDPGRNPAGLDNCEAVCRQSYLCNGVSLGIHEITRRFRKGRIANRDVTIVDVTKTDQVQGPGDFPTRTLPPGDAFASAPTAPAQTELT